MKEKYVHALLNWTINALKTVASTNPKPGGDLSGIIGLTGAAQGAVVVSFSKACALKIISTLLMEDYTEINEEVKGIVGEITNMISGDARRNLGGLGIAFKAGIPTVIIGKGHEIKYKCNVPCYGFVILFTCGRLEFFVEASFER